ARGADPGAGLYHRYRKMHQPRLGTGERRFLAAGRSNVSGVPRYGRRWRDPVSWWDREPYHWRRPDGRPLSDLPEAHPRPVRDRGRSVRGFLIGFRAVDACSDRDERAGLPWSAVLHPARDLSDGRLGLYLAS